MDLIILPQNLLKAYISGCSFQLHRKSDVLNEDKQ